MSQQRRRERGRVKPPRPEKPAPKHTEDEYAYAPVKPVNRKKLVLQLLTVAAVALAVAIGLSIFFKVDTISVSGLDKYSYDSVSQASEIQIGDSLLFFSRAEVSSKIMQALPYIKSVRIGITLPGTVNIAVEEVMVVYSAQDTAGNWWLISAAGTVLEKTDGATANASTTIVGVTLVNPTPGAAAVAAEETADTGTPVTVTGADRLAAALAVAQMLEKNEILGEYTHLDVTSPYNIQLWYGTDYCVVLGDSTQLDVKIACMKSAMKKVLDDYPPGSLDLSDVDNPEGFPYSEFDK